MRKHCCLCEPAPSTRNSGEPAFKPDGVVLPFPVGGIRVRREPPPEIVQVVPSSVLLEFQLEDVSSVGRHVCVPFLALLYTDDARRKEQAAEEERVWLEQEEAARIQREAEEVEVERLRLEQEALAAEVERARLAKIERDRPKTLEEMMYGPGVVLETPPAQGVPRRVLPASASTTLYDTWRQMKKAQRAAAKTAANQPIDLDATAPVTARDIAHAAAKSKGGVKKRPKARPMKPLVAPQAESTSNPAFPMEESPANPVLPKPIPESKTVATALPCLGSSHHEREQPKKAKPQRQRSRSPLDRGELITCSIKGVLRDQRIAHVETLTAALHIFCPGGSLDMTVDSFVYTMVEGVPEGALKSAIHRALGRVLGPMGVLRRQPETLVDIGDESVVRAWRERVNSAFVVYEWQSPIGKRIVLFRKNGASRRSKLDLHALLTADEFDAMLEMNTSCCTPASA